MKERPILFSGPMVRAILDGRKTQTRRVIKPQPFHGWYPSTCTNGTAFCHPRGEAASVLFQCPYGVPGDRLWVRESGWLDKDDHRFFAYRATPGTAKDATTGCLIGADPETVTSVSMKPCYKAVPSIHMPRWASRITLEITDVRVQRIQDTSPEDCIAEGRSPAFHDCDHARLSCEEIGCNGPAFNRTWDAINAKRGFGWDANPWVWAITFRRAL